MLKLSKDDYKIEQEYLLLFIFFIHFLATTRR